MPNSYSLALFDMYGANKLRQWAVNADENGNRNGMLDGKEIEIFKNDIKNRCGYDFDFTNITPVEIRTLDVYDEKNDRFIYPNATEVCRKYNSTTTKIINAINPPESKREQKAYNEVTFGNYVKEHGVKYAHMEDEDFTNSKKSIEAQEVNYREACENLEKAQTKLENTGLDEYYTIKLDGDTVVIDIKEGITRTRDEIIENFGFSQMSVKRDEYTHGNELRVPLDEFCPIKEKNFLQKLLGL